MFSKQQIEIIKKKYGVLILIFSIAVTVMTGWNTFHDFIKNISIKENNDLLVTQKHAIKMDNSSFLFYENDNKTLTPINYIAFIEVINNTEKITKLISCKLEIFTNNIWMELPLLSKDYYNYNDDSKYINRDYFYVVKNPINLEECKKVDYYSFKAQALYNEIKPGQSIKGWLPFQWPSSLLTRSNIPNFNKFKYTFQTKQGQSISKIIANNDKATKLGNFVNKYASAMTVSQEKHDLSQRIIITSNTN